MRHIIVSQIDDPNLNSEINADLAGSLVEQGLIILDYYDVETDTNYYRAV